MFPYVVRRLGQGALVVLSVSVVVFGMMYLTGDPVRLMLPLEATEEDVQGMRQALGLTDPLPVQYLRFLRKAVRGDFGDSLWMRLPARDLVFERLPATLELAVLATGISVVIAIPLGVLAAVHRNSFLDRLAMVLAVVGQSTPTFWLGIMLLLVFSVNLGLFPTFGRSSPHSIVLPAVTLAAYSVARLARLTRSSVMEILLKPYIWTARAKGLRERTVLFRHALKNAGLPILTLIGLELGTLLGGAVITESVFAWPGVGLLILQAVRQRDYPLVQAGVFVVALMFVLINLALDFLFVWVNPVVRLT